MVHRSPISARLQETEAFFLTYGPEDARTQLVETFGELDMEYAAIRKGCVLFDAPHLGTLRITGSERLAFLNNMITNKTDALEPGACTDSFWLNKKGRIDADLRLIERGEAMLVRLDRHLAQPTAAALSGYLFSEDCAIEDASGGTHWMSIHGPTAPATLDAACEGGLSAMGPGANMEATIGGVAVTIDRDDLTGEPGYWLCVPVGAAAEVHSAITDAGTRDEALRLRGSGWLAINTARIEAGRPMFNIDFGPDALPAESGIFPRRVSTTKGCYLGQEVVARMHARNIRKRGVVALRLDEERVTMDRQRVLQPVSGSHVFERGKEGQTPIGVVTSSTISPMLGAIPACFAMVHEPHTAPGSALSVAAEGSYAPCVVRDGLAFWSRER